MNIRTFIALTAFFAFSSPFGGRLTAQTQFAGHEIKIVDQNGRPVPNGAPSLARQIVDVTVGPGGTLTFSPNSVNISVGDTVRWTWGSSLHSVTSGTPCTADSQYCSPNDMNCSAGTLSNSGAIYQHTFTQAGTFSYFCAAHCAFGMTGTGTVSGAAPLQITTGVSRKTHGAAGVFDINLPLSGTPGLDSRTGDYTMVATFTNNVVSGNASVTSGVGTVNGSPVFSGQTMTINLTGVATAQTLTVTLRNVTDEFSQVLPDTPVSMRVLIGDTNANGTVNAADVSQTKAQLGQGVTGTNFRTDVNANGVINSADVAIVKSHLGEGVP
ncbi:MAG TPA: plastocyanin/azurin family copper-binding protein [Candidatus Acidoferrum sp.]|nr:plastocyanin/azurin family copper-binding protein [Candidatus Acidoferrum sp.]